MSRNAKIALSVAALLVVAGVGIGLFVRSSMQAAAPAAVLTEPAVVNAEMYEPAARAAAPAAAPGARSTFVSEEELKQSIEEAADHGWDAQAAELLRIFNKRHEHRCCGLPR